MNHREAQPYFINGVDVHSSEFRTWLVRENNRARDAQRPCESVYVLTVKYAAQRTAPAPVAKLPHLRLATVDGKRVPAKRGAQRA